MMNDFLTPYRIAAVYAVVFFALGIHLPFFPLLLAFRGMDETQIGIIVAAPFAIRAVVAPLIGMLADRVGDRRWVMAGLALISALGFSCFRLTDGFVGLLIVTMISIIPLNAITPALDALATAVVRRGGGDYGRMRMWGSAAFVAANLSFGAIIAATSADAVYWGLLGMFWLCIGAVWLAPPPVKEEPVSVASVPPRSDMRMILADIRLMGGLLAVALIQASHAMSYGFGSLYWNQLGFSGGEVGTLWALGVISEVLMFAVSGWLFRRLGPGDILALSGLGAVARWLIFPHVESYVGFVLLQAMHAVSFGCGHLATMRLLMARVPDRSAATVQGLYTTVGGLALAAVTLISGPLFHRYGVGGFNVMALIAALGLVVTVATLGLELFQPQRAAVDGLTRDP